MIFIDSYDISLMLVRTKLTFLPRWTLDYDVNITLTNKDRLYDINRQYTLAPVSRLSLRSDIRLKGFLKRIVYGDLSKHL